MKIVIVGASGFLGKALAKYYREKGAEVHLVSRSFVEIEGAQFHKWDGKTLGSWVACLEGADAVINMAGKSVDCRYTEKNKALIYSSRIDATTILGMAIQECKHAPKLWLNSSSATIYRHAEDRPQDEPEGELGNDFSPDVCKRWEQALFESVTPRTLKYALRASLVLGKEGGVLPVLERLTKLGLGGKQGSGLQKVSWIHIDDFVRAVDFIVCQKIPEGIYNVCAPHPTNNQTMMRILRKVCGMPIGLPATRSMLELGAFFLNTETELVLKSRWVLPTKLLKAGFEFRYDTLEKALMAQ